MVDNNANETLPRSRAEAKGIEAKHYFTGKECKAGHIERRSTHTGRCLECDRERKRRESRDNPDEVRSRKRLYREKNIDAVRKYERERSRKRYQDNPEKRRAYNKKWRADNAEQERKRSREKYYRTMRDNPEQIRSAGKRGNDKRRSTPKGKLENAVKAGVHRGLVEGAKRCRRTFELLGYSLNQLMRHLEKHFHSGMTWENYGNDGWHIDHKIPLSAHNYETPDDADFKRAWALKNLQPMWGPENISKGARLDKEFQPSLALH